MLLDNPTSEHEPVVITLVEGEDEESFVKQKLANEVSVHLLVQRSIVLGLSIGYGKTVLCYTLSLMRPVSIDVKPHEPSPISVEV